MSGLDELYDAYDGDWRRFFTDVQKYWREREPREEIQQPFLKGCPWCGVVPAVRKLPLVSPDTYDVTCLNRKCPRRIISAASPEECAARWNTRA